MPRHPRQAPPTGPGSVRSARASRGLRRPRPPAGPGGAAGAPGELRSTRRVLLLGAVARAGDRLPAKRYTTRAPQTVSGAARGHLPMRPGRLPQAQAGLQMIDIEPRDIPERHAGGPRPAQPEERQALEVAAVDAVSEGEVVGEQQEG